MLFFDSKIGLPYDGIALIYRILQMIPELKSWNIKLNTLTNNSSITSKKL